MKIINVKILFLKFIIYIPIYNLKNMIFRKVYGYKIGRNVKIEKSFINCKSVEIGNDVFIADNNTFSCESIQIGNNTKIHSGNNFIGGASFSIGSNSRIINNHFFDLYNNITIGNNTWVARKNSQFWTHGSIHTKKGNKDLSILIKDDIYIGSSVCVAPETKI